MPAFSVANDETLTELIRGATHRLVFVAPGVSDLVADALIQRLQELPPESVSITLDVDAEIIRLGYGDQGALERLYEATRKAGKPLTRHHGVRVGLVIANETMLVFAPIPLLIEAGPTNLEAHNAVMVGLPPLSVIAELGLGPQGVIDQTVGLDIASADTISQVKQDLEQNPPQKFDITRTVHVFNAYFEFVEFELIGVRIDKKTVPIPADLMGLAENERIKNLLTAKFKIIEPHTNLSGSHLEQHKNLIIKKFLKTLPRYGNTILRTDKLAFEQDVWDLHFAVINFQGKIERELQSAMDENREALLDVLLPAACKSPPGAWRRSDGTRPDKETVRQLLSDSLREAFGSAQRLISGMEVNLRFKGVTYELLQDEDFVKVAREAYPDLVRLLDEYKASRGRN